VLLKKIAIFAALAAVGLVYLGWLSKERAQRFVVAMVAFFVIASVVRIGAWCLSLSAAG
jgi:uncharacterized membrane protein